MVVAGECKSAHNLDLHSLLENVHNKIVNNFVIVQNSLYLRGGLFLTIPSLLVIDLYSETLLSLTDIGSLRS